MLKNYQEFETKAEAIRSRFYRFRDDTNADERLDAAYKENTIQDAKIAAADKMRALRAEYRAAKEQERKDLTRQAFVCLGDEGAYLQTMAQADSMDSANRQRAASNAMAIGATDHIRAVAHSAFNNGDSATVNYIRDNSGSTAITEPIKALVDADANRGEEIQWEMFAFAL